MFIRRLAASLLATSTLVLAGCGGNTSCKDACAKLDSCNLADSSFTCSDSCSDPAAGCASCINSHACGAILSSCGREGSGLACGASDIHPK
ncbi:MAG TPA: hypothetical protein VFP65_22915 [Anaeromyxobacteraceae bacterium]|nr:hypothetical protein [Anaeromyxobacteraceae bacterium]